MRIKQSSLAAQCLRLIGRNLLRVSAALFILQIAFAMPPLNDIVQRWTRVEDAQLIEDPKYIVVLGGGGIPSSTGLMRTYFGAKYSLAYPGAIAIVALVTDVDPATSSVGRMRDELVMRGVPAESILLETKGRNTHEQAKNIRTMLGPEAADEPVLLVTSPTHLRRSLLCFSKAGFSRVSGVATHGIGAEADIGRGAFLRYTLWTNLQLQIRVLREIIATTMYRLRGWI